MTQADLSQLTIGVLGGTGPQGRGLAYRWALCGLRVGRTQTNGPRDYEEVHKVQDGFAVAPPSPRGETPRSVAAGAIPAVF